MKKTILATTIGLMMSLTPAYALIPNGDFETGDLSGYRVQEDTTDVPSSPLVGNVDDGTGNHVGELRTGFTSDGVTISSLVADFGALPADVQDLVFDVKFLDVGEDNPPILALFSSPASLDAEPLDLDPLDLDTLYAGFGTPDGLAGENLFTLSATGFTVNPGTEVETLSNGFYRVKTNVSGLTGQDRSLFLDLRDGDDNRLSKVQVDNIDLTTANQAVAPEPASMLLIGGGLLGAGYLRRKKIV